MKTRSTTQRHGLPRRATNLYLYFLPVLLAAFCCLSVQTFAQLSRLHASGTRIVNAGNQEVILKGVGLGSWMLQEGYMIKPSFTGAGTQWSIKKRLYDQGQTDAQVEAFYQRWRDNFITKADIDFLASKGFNCVRLPLHYELFLTASQRAVRNSVAHNPGNYTNYVSSLTTWYNNNQLFNGPNLEGFRLTDSLLKWTAANNMYVVLDLHAAPGAQGTDANISDALVGNDLWNRQIYKDITVRLWQRLSSHYINNNGIAFYDLINEPNNVPDNRTIHDLFERLINAIRAQGDDHLLMIEGNGWGNNYNYMEPFTFSNRSNLVYSAHRYWITNSTTETNGDVNQVNLIANLVNFRNTNQVPVWVGETGENDNNWLSENIRALNSKGIGWCHWTYKRFDTQENAALLHINSPYLMDGAANMAAVLNNIQFANCVKNNNTLAAVAPGIQPPPSQGPVGKTIWLKGFNGKYVSSENGEAPMNCNRDAVQGWEQFLIGDGGNGKITLSNQGKFVSSENGEAPITCNRATAQDWEKFDWIVNADGTISLRASNGLYISSENGTQAMTCNRTSIAGWEAFSWGEVSSAAPGNSDVAAAAGTFKVVGYMPSWSGDVNTVQYSKLTHINYAFLLPNSNGSLQAIENPSKLQNLVSKAHANGVKVMISVGGWNDGNDSGFEGLAASSGTRTTFVNNIISFVNQYGLDGVDIDWEYPDAGASANNYLALMTQLSNEMHNRGKLLTAAVVAEGGSSILSGVFNVVDFLTIMAYDANNSNHSPYSYAVSSLNYWRNRGLAKEKAILGVPFYARPSWDSYATLLSQGASPNSDVFNGNYYNGIPTIKSKTNLAFDNGGGIMIWELSQDATGANSLLSAIHDVVLQRSGDTNPPPATGAPIGQTIWLQGFNGQYVSSKNGVGPMWCNATVVAGWNQFLVGDGGNGKITLSNQGKFVSSENGEQSITCNRTAAQDWEKFDWIVNADGTISLRGNNGLYVSSENGALAMTCNRTTIGGWEAFNYGVAGAAARTAIAATTAMPDATAAGKTGGALVYPNPVVKGSAFMVKVKEYDASHPVQVQLIDVNKRVVSYQKTNAGTLTIPTGNVPGGLYIITITNGKKTYTQKVIIQ
ncbi:MAG TPA: glycosyl hydrolase family 18 protein [Chitinophaga sp.]|uniref:glycosyl hydrolase family 18 protein n=1 Tax=Chitinophaga sp. TaxID=1869181 RepID=UPI002DC0412E|nr:glycosyl hydrolase family 18 protein [Chitinophaga sp.]HEU4551785.1 glycosyl hydrolase family 18 protein [Chitinophaga sp.]